MNVSAHETASKNDRSCYSTALVIQYAADRGIADEQIFRGIEEHREMLCNPFEWTDTGICTTLLRNIAQVMGGGQDGIMKMAMHITESHTSAFQLLFLRVIPLTFLVKRVGHHVEKNISRSTRVEIKSLRNGELNILFRPKNPTKISREICAFNKGCIFATAKLRGYRGLTITEESCAAADCGNTACHYKLIWTPEGNLMRRWKDFILFRFTSHREIIHNLEESHSKLQHQYQQILSMRDFYSHIMGSMSESVLWLDKEGIIEFSNGGFSTLVGKPVDDVKGKLFTDFFIPDPGAIDLYRSIRQKCAIRPRTPFTVEMVFKGGVLGRRIGQVTMTWVRSEHRTPGFLTTIRDITETRKIENELFIAKDRYRALYENSPVLIVGLNLHGFIIYANPATEEQTGYTEAELRNMSFEDLIAPNADFDLQQQFQNLLLQSTRLQEVHFKTKTGDWKCIALNTYQIFDENQEIAGVAGVGIDITETKRLNERLIKTQRMELLGQMAGGLAHDFNNLLTSISGYCALIGKISGEEKVKGYAAIIEQAGIRAGGLVKDLLSFSRGDVARNEKFDVAAIARETRSLARGAVSRSIDIREIVPDEPLYVMGDPGKIHQCLMNLCMNARDAIGDKSGAITLTVGKAENKDGHLWIKVDDTGTGISPDIIEKIFDPFFSTKEKKSGTGLGLSVVYGIVKAHKGDIRVDSRPGEGTTFTIELPLFEEETSASKKTVVVLDDDRLLGNFCLEILRESGYAAELFESMTSALAWIRAHGEDTLFILSDVAMPDMDVAKFVTEVGAIRPDLRIVWMSGYMNPEVQEIVRRFPFIPKPFQPTTLLEKISELRLA